MVRVARHGGRVVVSEPDRGTLVVDAPAHVVTRRLVEHHNQEITQPWIGRGLRRLFRQLGLMDVVLAAHTIIFERLDVADAVFNLRETAQRASARSVVSVAEATGWLEYLENADQAGHFLAAATLFTVGGVRRAGEGKEG
jgi:hypothetical protein